MDLQDLKPKSISDSSYAFMSGRDLYLGFGSTLILAENALDENYPGSSITQKDLFAGNFDMAVVCPTPEIVKPSEDQWINLPINDADQSMFNSIASAGEDLYWASKVDISKEYNMLTIHAAGILYNAMYKMPKTPAENISFNLDWAAYYYLYKMFKGVTSKKIGQLKVARESNLVFLTNQTEDFYIISFPSESLNYRSRFLQDINTNLSALSYTGKDTVSKKLLSTGKDALVKHLCKPLKESANHAQAVEADRYTDIYYTLHIFRKR